MCDSFGTFGPRIQQRDPFLFRSTRNVPRVHQLNFVLEVQLRQTFRLIPEDLQNPSDFLCNPNFNLLPQEILHFLRTIPNTPNPSPTHRHSFQPELHNLQCIHEHNLRPKLQRNVPIIPQRIQQHPFLSLQPILLKTVDQRSPQAKPNNAPLNLIIFFDFTANFDQQTQNTQTKGLPSNPAEIRLKNYKYETPLIFRIAS